MKKYAEIIDPEHIASLAAVKLDEKEAESLKEDLVKIAEFADALEKYKGADETAFTGLDGLREDIMGVCLKRESLLENAPSTDGVYFIMPEAGEI